ncbi:MAG: ABC transporter substrate-binding protein [Rhodospirillales bacterium]
MIATAALADEEAAGKFIEDLADKAVASLSVDGVSRDERAEKFHNLLSEHFAIETIGRWVLGRYWKKASKEERAEFLKLFEDLIVATYVDRFSRYSGSGVLKVIKTITSKDGDIVVYSAVKGLDGNSPAKVEWRIRKKNGSFKIVDVMIEGISMGLTQRSEFASVIRRNGGKVEGLLSALRKRLEKDA